MGNIHYSLAIEMKCSYLSLRLTEFNPAIILKFELQLWLSKVSLVELPEGNRCVPPSTSDILWLCKVNYYIHSNFFCGLDLSYGLLK